MGWVARLGSRATACARIAHARAGLRVRVTRPRSRDEITFLRDRAWVGVCRTRDTLAEAAIGWSRDHRTAT